MKIATLGLCESQPATTEGVRTTISLCPDLQFSGSTDTLARALEMIHAISPDIVLVDKAFGMQPILDWITQAREGNLTTEIVVWGASITEAEALRLLQTGAKGILRKNTALPTLVSCLRAVASGTTWMDDAVFRESSRNDRNGRSDLTRREQQVMELVEQGLKNKEIARDLGIRPGTVKIHLKHIFEKTGVRGRYGLAISGLKERGVLPASPDVFCHQ
jgi:DNA-binding NarL/FixJ family response regulator